ncbi:MAG: UDP-3-O-(3-hydroxymyristoyl)glucosamine N-acyltransferase [Planctomycetota bacterium]|nr:UDP-3-O-(3-hydroxymyristoyl)glucosamine N-acyltransferase [Planctomycetota bacterium]
MNQAPKVIMLAEIVAVAGAAPRIDGSGANPARGNAPGGGGTFSPEMLARPITGVAALDDAGSGDVSFLSSESFVKQFQSTRAAAVLIHKKIKLPSLLPGAVGGGPVVLTVDDADLALAKVLALFAQPAARPKAGIDECAKIDPSAALAPDVIVGAFACVGRNAKIGAGTVIHPQVFVGDDVTIGEGCEIFPNVTVRERVSIGSRVIINSGTVVGTDGFGYRWDGQKQAKIPQIGTVVIEDDVEIGSCVCIDRAKFSTTRIGKGTKIDNLVQVAHNVHIGPHCLIAGQAGMAGSAVLGSHTMLGGQVAIRDHVTLGNGVMVAACSGVAEDVPGKAIVSGTPALPHRQSLREQAALRRLPDLIVQVRKLQELVDELSGGADKGEGAPG